MQITESLFRDVQCLSETAVVPKAQRLRLHWSNALWGGTYDKEQEVHKSKEVA